MSKLRLENKLENLEQIAAFIESFGDDAGLDNKTVFEINLIMDELFTNITNYAYSDDNTHYIDIFIDKDDNNITLRIIDDGLEFNPLKKEKVNTETNLDDRNIGGLGIHIVRQKTDSIFYERKDDKNILTMTKKIEINGDKNGN